MSLTNDVEVDADADVDADIEVEVEVDAEGLSVGHLRQHCSYPFEQFPPNQDFLLASPPKNLDSIKQGGAFERRSTCDSVESARVTPCLARPLSNVQRNRESRSLELIDQGAVALGKAPRPVVGQREEVHCSFVHIESFERKHTHIIGRRQKNVLGIGFFWGIDIDFDIDFDIAVGPAACGLGDQALELGCRHWTP